MGPREDELIAMSGDDEFLDAPDDSPVDGSVSDDNDELVSEMDAGLGADGNDPCPHGRSPQISTAAAHGRSTMRDVAQLAGVSIKSVSRVVNGDPNVSSTMRHRVQRTIRQLDFVPDASAAALRRSDHRTRILGILLQDLGNDYSARLFHQLEKSAWLSSYALFTASLEEQSEKERRIIQDLLERRVDGLILIPTCSRQDYLQTRVDAGLALVCVDRRPSGLMVDSVTTDNWLGAKMATEHLINQGHRKIAFLGDYTAIESSNDRFNGYLDALRSAGVPADPRLLCTGIRSIAEGRQALDSLLDAGTTVTAVMTGRNDLTVGAVSCLQSRGLNTSIALVGFDDVPMAQFVQPPVTVVEQAIETIAEKTARRIVARVDGDISPIHDIVVPPRLVIRGSGEIPPQD
ncbi:LacI family DNA-binding transcriptional regulator [Propionibacterium sp.]|uniref:LacI family DNA-binding transcriptional regulator n=1 Tax=Propionibacterium sp. TaxID=1977903 RepID=UPI0039E9085D